MLQIKVINYLKIFALSKYSIGFWAFCFCCAYAQLKAQEPFHVVFDFDYHQQQAYKIIQVDTMIYISGVALPKGAVDNERSMYMASFDQHGTLVGQTTYLDEDNAHTYSNLCRYMVVIGDEIFMSNNNRPNVNEFISYQLVTGYSMTADTFRRVLKVEAAMPERFSPTSAVLAATPEEKLALVLISNHEEDSGVLMHIIDPALPFVIQDSFELYRPEHEYYAFELLVRENHYYILGFVRTPHEGSQLFCLKLDSGLNLVEESYYTELNYEGGAFKAHFSSEGDIYISAIHFIVNSHNQREYRPISLKLNSDLELVWQVSFGDQDYDKAYTTFFDIVESHEQDGSIFIGVRELVSENTSYGVIGKISSEGDSLFYKYIEPLDGNYKIGLFDMDYTQDGNYIATGRSWPIENADSVYFKGLIIKFDEYGNICPRDKSTSIAELPDLDILIYPNPVSDLLHLDVGADLQSCTILDSQGRPLHHKQGLQQDRIYIHSVSTYPSGTYYLRVVDNNGQEQVQPFIVQR